MTKNKAAEKRLYYMLSGEGSSGTWEKFESTPKAAKARATMAKRGGDRWARLYIYVPENIVHSAHILEVDGSDMRDVPEV